MLFRLSQKLASNADFSSNDFLSPESRFFLFLCCAAPTLPTVRHRTDTQQDKPEFIRSFCFRLLSMQCSRRGYRVACSGKCSPKRLGASSREKSLLQGSQTDEGLAGICPEEFSIPTSVLHSNLNIKDLLISSCSRRN